MTKLLLCLGLLLPLVQSDSDDFYVRYYADSEFNAHHIFSNAHHFVPPDEPICEKAAWVGIECLLRELKASGIYLDVQAELGPGEKDNTRNLLVRTQYNPDLEHFVIYEIVLDGLPDVDIEKFQSSLRKKGVGPGTRFLKYAYSQLDEKIHEALRDAYPKNLEDEDDKPLWITLRPSGYREIRFTISSTLPKCEAISATALPQASR